MLAFGPASLPEARWRWDSFAPEEAAAGPMPPTKPELFDAKAAARFYDQRYAQGYMDDWPAWKKARIVEVVRALALPRSGRVLDYGCGAGSFHDALAEALPGWDRAGTELSAEALARARQRHPGADWFAPSEGEARRGGFDLVFSHHVLEHVASVEETWRDMERYLKPDGHMLHILPCGDVGSLERSLVELRKGGIDPRHGDRFDFEDVAHLRRLTTAALGEVARAHGFELLGSLYANQLYGSLADILDSGPRHVWRITSPRRARGLGAATLLVALRGALLPAATAAGVARVQARLEARAQHALPRLAWRAARPAGALGRFLLERIHGRAAREWDEHQRGPGGAEMYLHFARRRDRGGGC